MPSDDGCTYIQDGIARKNIITTTTVIIFSHELKVTDMKI